MGVPDLEEVGHETVFVEWAAFPDMSINPRFVAEVLEAVGGGNSGPLLFLCRSGARSLRAAAAVHDHLSRDGRNVTCLNVAEGFEGDLDPQGHRGGLNGWKARGLAWRQS
ncbi:rhodanese-like domain-containing protein [Kangsaoukella pontilimi]|uniref:rhodanese-like domain-containing protein n=1 Tax=Kangsaoukella pontilimi TaxID=2691042 RepID=UPI001D0B9FC2|nr:rhodanese-like domain-containing protein [Kangsaoukella pontilimi]